MTYTTIDSLPDLTKAQMNAAHPLVFAPLISEGITSPWDLFVHVFQSGTTPFMRDLFSFTGTAGIPYDIFSNSSPDPSMIQVYDSFGNVIAIDQDMDGTNGGGSDFVNDLVAPYTGTYYIAAGWPTLPTNQTYTLSVYADLDPVTPVPYVVTGTSASDPTIYLTEASDQIDGGAGIDTVFVPGSVMNYSVVLSGGSFTVKARNGFSGTDTMRNIEVLQFTDTTFDTAYLELTQALYVSYFGRAADVGGLKSFQSQLTALGAPSSVSEFSARYATDSAVKSLIDSFGSSSESSALYSGDNKAFVKAIYFNLLNRAPDQAGLDFWSGAIDGGGLTRANASLSIMAGALANGTAQGRDDAALVRVKVDVASNFTFALETQSATAAYNGADAAAVARALLRSLSSGTDVMDFQASVKQAVGRLPSIPRSPSDHPDDMPQAGGDAMPILLTGIDNTHDAAILG
ncbi:MAG TPA: DUF4214 domain-containing protein [Telluria sp.]|jgi:hypothetical protein